MSDHRLPPIYQLLNRTSPTIRPTLEFYFNSE